ncbi:MAG: hypothetical protein C4312_05295, partial [Thermoflexus sp.]
LAASLDVCLEPVLEPEEAIGALPELAPAFALERGTAALPFTVDGRRLEAQGSPPRLGEHTLEVLEALGEDPEVLRDLARQGVLGIPADRPG